MIYRVKKRSFGKRIEIEPGYLAQNPQIYGNLTGGGGAEARWHWRPLEALMSIVQ
jgi:hypothetical protein